MAEYVNMPMLGQTMEEGTVVRWFKNEGDTPETKDLSYAAARNAELAETRARTIQASQMKDQTNANSRAKNR